ncbi:MAG: beta strand repeat-containing protein [Planctomycetota bacterium]
MVSVGGNASFTTSASGATITLDQTTVTGSTTLNTNGASGNASFTTTGPVSLNGTSTGGKLTVSTNGNITQSAALTVGGTTSLTGNNITLANGSNSFTGDVTFNAASNATINDNAGGLGLGAGSFAIGNATITSAGAITDAGPVSVGGNASFTGTSATLNDLIVSGTVGVNVAGAATLVNATALTLAASTIGTNLDATATTGALTDSGTVTIGGDAKFTTASKGDDITLDQTTVTGTTQFNTTGVNGNASFTTTGAVSLNGSSVGGDLAINTTGTIGQTAAVTVGSTTSLTGTAIALNNGSNSLVGRVDFTGTTVDINDSGNLILAASTATGSLTLNSGGAITQTGALSVGTTSSITATGNITLDNAGNSFGTTVGFSGANVALRDSTALALATSTATGTLDLTSNGAITQSGASTLSVTGAATLAAGATNDINLTNANNFSSIGITSANNVSINDTDALALNASTVSGTLSVTTSGAITDNGALAVTGAATFAAGSAKNITLDNANNFSSVGITSGNNVVLNDTSALVLNASTVSGTLGVTTNGPITQSGAVSVANAATFAAGNANDINLGNTGNDFNSVGITSGRNVTLGDANSIALDASTVSGTLGVTASAGAITDNGALVVTGAATFAATTGITLDAANNFSSVNASTTGGDVVLNDTGDLVIAGVNANTSRASISAAGAVTQTAAITGGSLELTGAGSFTLTNTANNVANLAANTTGAVSYTDSTALGVGATVGATAGITSSGAVTVVTLAGALTLTATGDIVSGGDVNLTGAAGISTSGDVTTTNDNVSFLSNTTLTGNVSIDTGAGAGNIVFAGTVDGGNNLTLAAGAGDVNFSGAVGSGTRLGAITINSADDVTAAAITAASITQATGTGATTLGGAIDTNAAAGVSITNETIDLNAGLTTTAAGAVTFNATLGALTIAQAGDIISDGTVSLTGQGGIVTGGDVITTGDTVGYNNNVTLAGNVSVATTSGSASGAAINFSGSVNADNAAANNRTLTLDSGNTGSTIGGNIGNLQPLAGLTVTNALSATFNSDVFVSDGAGIVNFVDTTNSVTFNGSLVAGRLLTGFNPFDLFLLGSNNVLSGGPTTLTNTGIVQIGDSASDVSLFTGGLSVTSSNPNTKVAGFIRTASSPISISRANLVNNTTLDTTNNGASVSGATISLLEGIALNGFTLQTISGTTGGTSITGTTDINNGSLTVASGNLTIGDGTTATTLNVTAPTTIDVQTGALNVLANSTIVAGANNLTLIANTMNIQSGTNSISTTGTLTVAPSTASRPIFVGGAASGQSNSLQLNQTAIDAFSAGLLVIGASGDTGTLTVGALNINDALQLIANGGGAKVVVSGAINSTYSGALTGVEILGSGATTVLGAGITTTGTAVVIDDSVQVNAGTITIATGGDDVTITGGANGIFSTKGANNNLTISAGIGNVVLGSLRGFGNGGTGSLVGNLTVDGATINLPSASAVNGLVLIGTLTPASTITLGETLASGNSGGIIMVATDIDLGGNVTAGATLTINGAVALASGVVLAGDGIAVTGSIVAAGNDLTLDGRSGTVGTPGAVSVTGDITDAAGLTLLDAAGATFGSAATGAVSAQTVQISSTNTGTVQFSNNLAVAGTFAAASGSYALSIIGGSSVIGGPVSFLNTGILTLGNDNADSTQIQSGVSRNQATRLQGTVTFGGGTTLASVNATTAGGALNLTADSLNLGYNNAGNGFGGVSITSAGATTFTAGALASTILTVNAGSIGQTGGTLAPTSGAIFTSTGTIALGGANNFGGTVQFNGVNVSIRDTNQLDLAPTSSNATGNLVLSSSGNIVQQGGLLTVVGSTTLTSGQDISIILGSNSFTGPVAFTGVNVSLGASNSPLTLAASTATGTLTLSSGTNPMSQTGILSVTGTTSLTGSDISLGLANTFTGNVGFTWANVTINDAAGALNITANSTASGNLALSAAGDITDAGNLSATGNASFSTPQNVNLSDLFVTGTVSVNTGGNATLVDKIGGMELGASTVGGNLTVTAATGVLSDTGTISVTGNAIFQASTAGAGIVLDQISVTGTINLDTAAGGNASVTSARPLTFNGSSVRGDLAVTTPGNISQTGAAFTVTGNTTLSGAVINLGNLSNDFQGTVGFTGSNVTLRDDTGGLALAASSATGNLFVQALGVTQTGVLSIIGTTGFAVNAGNIVLSDAGNSFTGPVSLSVNSSATLAAKTALVFDTSTVGGNLTIDSIGVDQVLNKFLIVNGDADIDVTSNGDISLDNSLNNFGTLFSFNARNVALTDLDAINFGNGTAAGTLAVVASGTITQAPSTALNITGNATFTNTTGATGDITLANAGNAFAGTVGFTGNDVNINDSTPLVLAESLATATLNLTNATSITQTGKLTVTGNTTASVTSGNITLGNAGNAFTGSVGLTVGGASPNGNAVVTDSTALDFGATTVSGTLLATSGGAVTQSGAVAVTGNTTLVANGFDINLPLANNFSSVGFGGADDVSITDSTGISLNTGSITGALAVNATGDITDNGPLTVAGSATFNARFSGTGTPGDVILDASNDFNSVGIALASDVVLNDINALTLDNSLIQGTLDVTTSGAITGQGALVVAGISTFSAGQANNITLNNALNDFSTAQVITGKDVVITDSSGIDLGASTVSGKLDISAIGAITDSGALAVTGAATFDAGSANNITLNDNNEFSSVGILSGKNVVINDISALVLAASSVSGTFDVLTDGAITDSSNLEVAGAATFRAGPGNDITLNAGNDFNSVGITSGRNVFLNDINDLVMVSGNISGTLGVTAGNSITGTSPLVVAGSATFESFGLGDVSLTGANDFSSVGITNAGDVTINDINSLILAASTLAGDLDVTAFGAITDSGAISAQGKAAFNSTGIGDINLDQLNVIGLITADTIVGDATLVNAVATSFGGSVGGLFSVRAITGGVTDGGPVITTNGLVLQAPGTSQISQALTGTGGLTFNGTGTLTVAGANTYTGDTVITSGVLTLTGSLATSHVRAQGGTLRGNGNLGNLSSSSGGTVRPGNSPGSFTSSGPISIGASSTYTVEINGLNPVSGYSQLVAPGATFGGILTLTTANPGFNPQIGTRFTIIDNSGPNKVSGTFAGLPEGGVVFNGNQGYTITYKGGTGNNDVQLIRTNVIPTPTGPVVTTPFNLNPGVIVSATNGTPAQVQLSTVSGGFNGGVTRRIVPFRGYTGMISVNALDRTGDGVADSLLVSKATPGNLSTVMVIDAATGRVAMQFNAFGNKFFGGARVSSGLTTINGLARTVITVAAGPGSAPTVKVYDAITGSLVKSFNAFGNNYRSGLDIAMTSQTATQPGVLTVVSLVNSFVRVFDLNNTAAPLASFQAFTQQPMPATSIAVGDVNGDGNREIIVGIGNLNQPAVRVFSMTGQRLSQFTPYPLEYTGGVTVGVNDYDRDGVLDIVTVAQSVARGRVRIFRATGSPVLGNFRLASVLTLATAGSNGVIEVQQPA